MKKIWKEIFYDYSCFENEDNTDSIEQEQIKAEKSLVTNKLCLNLYLSINIIEDENL